MPKPKKGFGTFSFSVKEILKLRDRSQPTSAPAYCDHLMIWYTVVHKLKTRKGLAVMQALVFSGTESET